METQQLSEQLVAELERIRTARGWSYADLAVAIGVDRKTLWAVIRSTQDGDMPRGVHGPGLTFVLKVQAAFPKLEPLCRQMMNLRAGRVAVA